MGGDPWCAMCLAFFPPYPPDDEHILVEILEGALEIMDEAQAVLAGGHTVQDEELKFGLSVTGIIDPARIARNDGLLPGQHLLLTKPLGIGILATGVKARWDYAKESEEEIAFWCSKLNKPGAEVIQTLGLSAATDITGFGLGGHALEMARASHVAIELFCSALPLLPHTLEYALDGLIPGGTHANQKYFAPHTLCKDGVDKALLSIIFDAQTSGGLLLAVAEHQREKARAILLSSGALACEVGRVRKARDDGKMLIISQGD